MSKSKFRISEFTFVGQLSDCIRSKKAQIKYFKIANGEEKNWIKLSKKNRNSLEEIIPGCWLKVQGQKKLCLKTGVIELKADTIETTTIICDSNCNKCDFKRLVYSGSAASKQSSKKKDNYYHLEAGLQEHFRIRVNFCIDKYKSRRSNAVD